MSDNNDQSNKRKTKIIVIPAIPKHLRKCKRVALYCRVSTEMDRQLNSLECQMEFQKQDIMEKLDWRYVATYSDTTSGRTIKDRPGFKKMLEACEAGEIDLIYTKSISRFGRNCEDFLITLRRLKELNVDVYFQNEMLFLHDPKSELMLTLHSAWAEAESANKSENIKWGIRRSTLNPQSPAFSRKCFGYEKDDDGNLVINPDEAKIVDLIYDLYGQGMSIIKIKKHLEGERIPTPTGKRKWALKTIDNILTNEKYTGTSVYGMSVGYEYPSTKRAPREPEDIHRSENHHPAIIDQFRFDQVQKLKKERSNMKVDASGKKTRKSTHYSMKKPKRVAKITVIPAKKKP